MSVRRTQDRAEVREPRPPSGLIADPGDNRVYLEWNRSIDTCAAGYHVYRSEGGGLERLTDIPLRKPEYVESSARNGRTYRYAVTVVDDEGRESELSNDAESRPRKTEAPVVEEGPLLLRMPGQAPVAIESAIAVRFGNGHGIVYDALRMRVRDWTNDGGKHLIYPGVYGNALDITSMDNWGFPDARDATDTRPFSPAPLTHECWELSPRMYAKADRGLIELIGYQSVDDRITFHYTIPLKFGEAESFTRVQVWETWFPVERDMFGTKFTGLNRRLELELPSYFNHGYSVCLNDGFGINGSCEGATTYDLQWATPFLDEVHWTSTEDIVAHAGCSKVITSQRGRFKPRNTGMFHPTPFALQVHPYLFINFEAGTYLIAARRYYNCINYLQSNYVARGKDGIWPNLMVDCSVAGERYSVETFEYLFCDDTTLRPPQLYVDASMYFRRRLAHLYQLNPYLTAFDYDMEQLHLPRGDRAPYENLAEFVEWGRKRAHLSQEAGMDLVSECYQLWFTSPYLVEEEIFGNRDHPVNRAIARYAHEFRKREISFATWVRPEFIKTSTPNALSTRFTLRYDGYESQLAPPAMERIEKRGLPRVREHPEWLRTGRDGRLPNIHMHTAYRWTPVSLKGSWYEEVLLPTLRTMKDLGVNVLFQDGGFSAMSGVDYTGGRAEAVMPYYWRWFQDAARLGLSVHGELPMGWGNNSLPTPTEADVKDTWALVHSSIRLGETRWAGPRLRHMIHSLYGAALLCLDNEPQHGEVARFCQEFVRRNGHPDRVVLEGLRWAYLDASGRRSAVRGWIWDDVYWEYRDGRRVKYPSYPEAIPTLSESADGSAAPLEDGAVSAPRERGNTLPAG